MLRKLLFCLTYPGNQQSPDGASGTVHEIPSGSPEAARGLRSDLGENDVVKGRGQQPQGGAAHQHQPAERLPHGQLQGWPAKSEGEQHVQLTQVNG